MASLTKDSLNRSPFWTCCYTSATGQRLKKSTKITVKPLPGEKREDGTPKTQADILGAVEDIDRLDRIGRRTFGLDDTDAGDGGTVVQVNISSG